MSTSEFIIETHNPLESTVHISHIAQHAVAGERHAFLFEKTGVRRRRQNARSGVVTQNLTQKQRKQQKPPSFRAVGTDSVRLRVETLK